MNPPSRLTTATKSCLLNNLQYQQIEKQPHKRPQDDEAPNDRPAKKLAMEPTGPHSIPLAPEAAPIPTQPTLPQHRKAAPKPPSKSPRVNKQPKPVIPLNLDTTEGFMPSATNNYKFKFDSPSGRTAARLDTLLMPPAQPTDKMPLWFDSVCTTKTRKLIGSRPRPGEADRLVKKMERGQVVRSRLWAEADGVVEGEVEE